MKVTKAMARHHPVAWAIYCSQGRWKRSKHLMVLAECLMKLHSGEIKRLCISFPPRHGKSELVSKYFTSWWLGANPQDEVILASYAQRLTEQWSVAARDLLSAYGSEVFGYTTQPRSARSLWPVESAMGTKQRGSMFATGKGGAMTGRGADLLVCDDLIRDQEEAQNADLREKVWDWLRSVAFTRLSPKGRVVIIGTRWHHDDPIGRIERLVGEGDEEDMDEWHFINFPAIATEDEDPLGRAKGEALWPERFPVEALKKTRSRVGSYVWEALYQGSPTPSEGGMFKKDWFSYYEENKGVLSHGQEKTKVSALKRFATVDLAVSTKESADYTCVLVWGVDIPNRRLFLLDVLRRRVEGPDIVPMLAGLHKHHSFVGIYVEAVAFQLTIIQEAARKGLPVRKLTPDRDKVSRAIPATSVLEQGRLLFRKEARWLPTLETEMLQFPHGTHDDQVDCLAYAAKIFLDVVQAAHRKKRQTPRVDRTQASLRNRIKGLM